VRFLFCVLCVFDSNSRKQHVGEKKAENKGSQLSAMAHNLITQVSRDGEQAQAPKRKKKGGFFATLCCCFSSQSSDDGGYEMPVVGVRKQLFYG